MKHFAWILLFLIFSCGPESQIELKTGTWTGSLTPGNHPDLEEPLSFDVGKNGDAYTLAISSPNHPTVQARSLSLKGETLSFEFDEPEENVPLSCRFRRQSDGSFAGRCEDAGGKYALVKMLPPDSRSHASRVFWPPEADPVRIGKMVTDDIFTRSEFMMYDTEHCKAVHYAEACAAFGAARLAGLIQDSTTIRKLAQRYARVLDENIINTKNHVDANVYGILPLELHRQKADKRFLNQGMELADGQWANPLPNGLTNQTRFWIDDIWMIGSLQVQAYRTTGKAIYLERAALEIAAYLKKLQQPNGLFFHGEDAPFFWGRGNGWVAAGLAEIISELPPENEHYPAILAGYRKMMDALLQYQAADGMWRQLIDVADAWKETSCTAMFGYAFSEGVRRGILPAKKFRPAYQKAWLALVKYINPEGKVTDVCIGTGQSKDIHYYLERPTTTGDFHGQAPILWFAYSLLQYE